MNSAIHELARAVLKKPLNDCSLEELEQLTRQYPYFAPAQLLLAKKLSVEQNESPAYNEQVQRTSLYFPNRVWLDHLLTDYNDTNTAKINSRHEPLPMPAEENTAEMPIDELAKQEPTVGIPAEIEAEPAAVINEVITEPVSSVEQADNEIKESGDTMNKEEFPAPDLPAIESSTLNNPIEPANEKLTFEPYHTVDYFASQGIRFREEEKPKDHFSAQLKSFTEWLKLLKKSSPAEIAATTDPNAEKKVEQMAEFSLAERHVITEAMAEVWKKQGNKVRAEEIYRKLSLLDPSKTAYFAAKIADLKKTS